jgi:hypothetical protein
MSRTRAATRFRPTASTPFTGELTTITGTFGTAGSPSSLAVSNDGKYLYGTRKDANELQQFTINGDGSLTNAGERESAWLQRQLPPSEPTNRQSAVLSESSRVSESVASGAAASSTNLELAALRRVLRRAAEEGWLDHGKAEAAANVENTSSLGVRAGNWFTPEQAKALLPAPDENALKGKRDGFSSSSACGAGLPRLSRRPKCATIAGRFHAWSARANAFAWCRSPYG